MNKVEEMDFNGEAVTEETGQSETTDESKEEKETKETEETTEETKEVKTEATEETEEDVDSLPQWAKDRLKKVESDKDNYKKGMLKYKDKSLDVKKKKSKTEEVEEEKFPDWDEDSKKFQKQTLSEAEKRAEARAMSVIEKSNEKTAIGKFIRKNPELSDDSKWNEVISNYTPRKGKETVQDILDDLEEAQVVTNYRNGTLSEAESNAEKRGEKKGKAEAHVADMSSVSKTSTKKVKGKDSLSKGALEMADKMRVDPKDLAKEDDSPFAEIKL